METNLCAHQILQNNQIYQGVTEPLQVIFTRKLLASASEFSCTFDKIELRVLTD
uniref:Uncharacterized protein n=1 Tax=Setaria italica TaxID=4555 RepID=K3XUH9_SETIT